MEEEGSGTTRSRGCVPLTEMPLGWWGALQPQAAARGAALCVPVLIRIGPARAAPSLPVLENVLVERLLAPASPQQDCP